MSRTYFLSAASTYLLKSGTGTLYGYHVGDPAAGGTVLVADLLNLASNPPNLGIPSTFGNSIIGFTKFPASPQPLSAITTGAVFTSGLTVSIASTQGVTIYFD